MYTGTLNMMSVRQSKVIHNSLYIFFINFLMIFMCFRCIFVLIGSNSENIRKNFLFEGCKCIIHKRSNYRYYGYVQRLFPEQNRAIVFVEQLGELLVRIYCYASMILLVFIHRCEIAIDLIEPVITTRKSSSRSRRKSCMFLIFTCLCIKSHNSIFNSKILISNQLC
jgi:hypothetical protein